jgi:hypothetical protein
MWRHYQSRLAMAALRSFFCAHSLSNFRFFLRVALLEDALPDKYGASDVSTCERG